MIPMIVENDNDPLAIRRHIDGGVKNTVPGGIIANGDRCAPVAAAIRRFGESDFRITRQPRLVNHVNISSSSIGHRHGKKTTRPNTRLVVFVSRGDEFWVSKSGTAIRGNDGF